MTSMDQLTVGINSVSKERSEIVLKVSEQLEKCFSEGDEKTD